MESVVKTPLLNKISINLQNYLLQFLHYKDIWKTINLSKQVHDFFIKNIIKQAKTNKSAAYFYLQNYIVLNNDCHQYYKQYIYFQLFDADGLYSLVTSADLIAFYSFTEGVLLKEKESFKELKEKPLKQVLKNIRNYILSFLVQIINKAFIKDNIVYLDFNSMLCVNQINFDFFILFVKKNTSIEQLDISKSIISEDNMLSLLDAVERKESFYTLNLNEVEISQKIVVVITQIMKNDPKKQIKITKKYTGKSKCVINYTQVKNKQYKRKVIKPSNIVHTDNNNENENENDINSN